MLKKTIYLICTKIPMPNLGRLILTTLFCVLFEITKLFTAVFQESHALDASEALPALDCADVVAVALDV